jgi:predicted GIY-YIG superfamily endonuclease
MTRPHHSVYVVELDPAVRERVRLQRLNPDADPEKPCVYVGMTGLDPEERFENHRVGVRASPVVRDFGLRLLPELSEGLQNLTYELALRAEADLAAYLRQNGYFVAGGH